MNREFIKEVGFFKWATRWSNHLFVKRILRRSRMFTTPVGTCLTLPPDSRFGSEIYVTNGNVDWGSEMLLYKYLDPEGDFLDIGANIGYYSIYMCNRASRVFAFEPDRRALTTLRLNAGRYSNIEVLPFAVLDRSGSAHLATTGSTELSRVVSDSVAGAQLVEAVTIDQFVADRKLRVSGIKVDAEGLDLRILAGGTATLADSRCVVLTEASPTVDLFSFANRIGYVVFAYTKTTDGITFRQLRSDSVEQTKMVFLIPTENAAKLTALA